MEEEGLEDKGKEKVSSRENQEGDGDEKVKSGSEEVNEKHDVGPRKDKEVLDNEGSSTPSFHLLSTVMVS